MHGDALSDNNVILYSMIKKIGLFWMFIWATAIVIDWPAAVALFIDSFLSWFLQIGSVLIVFSFCFFRVQDTYRSWSTSLWVKNHPVRPNTENDWSWSKSKQKQTNLNKSCDKTVKYIEQYSSENCFRECAVRTWSYPTQIRIMDYKRNFLSISVRIVY